MKKTTYINNLIAAVLLGLSVATQAATPTLNTAERMDVQFPDPSHSYISEGDFINPQSVGRMNHGLTKDQVALLLSNPHFDEGINSKTWNYLFNFYIGPGNEYVQCQYQVHFNAKNEVDNTAWRTGQCEDLVNPRQKPVIAKMVLAADGMFAFGKGQLVDMDATGVEALNGVVDKIQAAAGNGGVHQITVEGFTDRFGSNQSNDALSRERALSVKNHLVAKGIDASTIRVIAKGETEPVVYCPGHKTPAVIACLKPNRRIAVTVE